MSPKIRPWKEFRPSSLTEQWSLVFLETFSGTDNQAVCGKLILMASSGQLMEATTQKPTCPGWPISLFVSSQVTLHNMAPWNQPTDSSGSDAKEWRGVKRRRRDKEPESAFTFLGTCQKTIACFQGSAHSPWGEREQDDCQLCSCWSPPAGPCSWHRLGGGVAYLSHLQSLPH